MQRAVFCALALTCFFAVSLELAAQPSPGDLLTVDTNPNAVLAAKRGGTLVTLSALPGTASYGPLVAGPGDGSVLLIGLAQTAVPRTYVFQVDGGNVVTLSSFFIFPQYASDMALDDAGDLLLLTKWSGVLNGIYRAPLMGASTLQVVTAWPRSAAETVAFTEQLHSGHWWALDEVGDLRLVDRNNGTVLDIVKTGGALTSLRRGDVREDPVTGDVLVAAGSDVLKYAPVPRTLTTVIALGQPQGGSEAMGLGFDEYTRGFLFSAWMGFGPGMFGFLHELDSQATTIVRSTALGSPRRPENVAVAWGRGITPQTPPAIGTRYAVALSSPVDAAQSYQAAVSLSPRPGVATPLGVIPLAPDPLFFFSLSNAPPFVNFGGILNVQGRATVGVDLPRLPLLRGTRIILAAVAYDGRGLRRILGPHGFTVR